MGINISDITNQYLKALAEKIDARETKDGNKNNSIIDDGEEKLLFNYSAQELVNDAIITEEDFNKTMGLYTSNPINNTENKENKIEYTTESTSIKGVDKQYRKYVLDSIKESIGSTAISMDDLLEELKEEYVHPKYAPILKSVEYLIGQIRKVGFKSKEDVEKLAKEIKVSDNAEKEFLNLLIKKAKDEQVKKETGEIIEKYLELVKNDKTVNFSQRQKDVEKWLKDTGKWNESYYQHAFNKEFKPYVKEDAVQQFEKDLTDTKSEKQSGVLKEVRETHKAAAGSKDNVYRHVSLYSNGMRNVTAYHNKFERRHEELGDVSEETLKKDLVVKTHRKVDKRTVTDTRSFYYKLEKKYLPEHQNTTGNYNLQELADAVFEKVGYDYELSLSDNKKVSERYFVKAALRELTGEDFSDMEVDKIVKYVGLHVEQRIPFKSLVNLFTGMLAGGAGSGIATSPLHAYQHVDFKLTQDVATNLTKQLTEKGFQQGKDFFLGADAAGKVRLDIIQEVLINDTVLNILEGVGAGLAIAALMSLIFGDGPEFEKACTSLTSFQTAEPQKADIKEFEKHARNTNPEKADQLIAMANLFANKDGKTFNYFALQQELSKAAGWGSILNCKEGRGYKIFGKPEEKPNIEVIQGAMVGTKKEADYDKKETTTEKYETTETYTVKGGDTWAGIVKAFYPCLVEKYGLYGRNGAIRKLKEALATKDGKIDKEMLKNLLEAGNLPKELILPEKIDDCDRKEDGATKIVRVQITKPAPGKEPKKSKYKTVGHTKQGEKPITNNVHMDGKIVWIAKDKADPSKFTTGETRDEALQKLSEETGVEYICEDKDKCNIEEKSYEEVEKYTGEEEEEKEKEKNK